MSQPASDQPQAAADVVDATRQSGKKAVGIEVARPMPAWLAWPLCIVLLALACIRALEGAVVPQVSIWLQTHYMFVWEGDFLKRGLIATLLELLSHDPVGAAWHLSLWVTAGLVALMTGLVARRITGADRESAILLGAFLLLGSGTVQHLVSSFGRFDAYVLLISLVAGLIALRLPARAGLAVILASLVLCLLIHEAALFLTAPLVLSLWAARQPRWPLGAIVLSAIFLGLVAVAVFSFGMSDTLSLESRTALYAARHGAGIVDEDSIRVLYRGLGDNVEETGQRGLTAFSAWHHGWLALGLWPWGLVWLAALAHRVGRGDRGGTVVLLSCLAPLALYPLGWDHYRWWAMVTILTTVALCLGRDSPLPAISRRGRAVLVAGIVLALVFGPVGDDSSFAFSTALGNKVAGNE